MTESVKLTLALIKEHFGEIIGKVAHCLLKQGPCSLRYIVYESKITVDQVSIHYRSPMFTLFLIIVHF